MNPQSSETSQSSISAMDFQRLEDKIDRMATALEKLVLIEERQTNQAIAITELRAVAEANKLAVERVNELCRNSIDRVEKKVDQWINRGIGVWALAGVAFVLFQALLRITGRG